MAFDDGMQNIINRLHETLKLLHETIQNHTKATKKQSKIMIVLTCALLGFTIALLVAAILQIPIFKQDIDTT